MDSIEKFNIHHQIQYNTLSFTEASAIGKNAVDEFNIKDSSGLIDDDFEHIRKGIEDRISQYAKAHSNNEAEFKAIYEAAFFGMSLVLQHPEHIINLKMLVNALKIENPKYKVGDTVFAVHHQCKCTIINVFDTFYRISINDKTYTCFECDLEPIYEIGTKVRIIGMTPVRSIVGRSHRHNLYQLAGKGDLYNANDLEIVND